MRACIRKRGEKKIKGSGKIRGSHIKKLNLAIILIIFLLSTASATTLRISGPKEVGESQKFNISVKSTVNNLAAFEIFVEAENVDFVAAYKGDAIKNWAFSYQSDGQNVRIIGIYNQKSISGKAMELAKLTFIAYENTTFVIDREESKLIDPHEKEIKIDRFYNHSVIVYRYGDVNKDNTVDVKDLIRLERIILNEEESTITSDLNDDGSVNILDLVKLINLLVEG